MEAGGVQNRGTSQILDLEGYKIGVQAPQAKIFTGTGVQSRGTSAADEFLGVQIRGTSRRRRKFLGVQGYKIGVQIGF